jgi:hypothetical protein
LEHEGALITAGEKHIITLNLWAMQKNTADDERIVHVTFPSVVPSPAPDQDAGRGKRQRTDTEDAQSHAAALRSALNDQSYAISVAALAKHEHCSLAAFVRFIDQQGSGNEPVLQYECKDATYEQFGTVYKILQQSYVSAEEIRKHAKAIDFYALDSRSILVDLADPKPDDAEGGENAASALATQLRAELSSLTPRMLQARALEMETAKDKVDAMLDAHDVKGFLIDLIIEAELAILRAPIHSSNIMQEREKDEQLALFGLSHPGGCLDVTHECLGYNQVRALGKATWAVQLYGIAQDMMDLAPDASTDERIPALQELLMNLLQLEGHTHDLIQLIFPEEMALDFPTAKASISKMMMVMMKRKVQKKKKKKKGQNDPFLDIPGDQLVAICSKTVAAVLKAIESLCEELLNPVSKFIDLDRGGIDVTVLPDHKRIEKESERPENYRSKNPSSLIRIFVDADGKDAAYEFYYGELPMRTFHYAEPITDTDEQKLAWAEYERKVEARNAAAKVAGLGGGLGYDPLEDACFVFAGDDEDEKVHYSRLRQTVDGCKTTLLTCQECEADMKTDFDSPTEDMLLDTMKLKARGDVIVCGTEQRTGVISACAKGLGAPYLPFRVAFIEGLIDWGNGDCQGRAPQQLPMTAVWVSLGDYDNVFACRSIEVERVRDGELSGYGEFELDTNVFCLFGDNKGMLEESNAAICLKTASSTSDGKVQEPKPVAGYTLVQHGTKLATAQGSDADDGSASGSDDYDYDERKLDDSTVCYGLNVAIGREQKAECAHKSELIQKIMSMSLTMSDGSKSTEDCCGRFDLAIVLPDAPEPEVAAAAAADAEEATVAVASPYFHIDAAGNACFTKDEAALASTRIMEIDLVDQVKRKILSTDFVLPQLKQTASAHFCNEAIYGKMNMLMVTGIVRLG